MVCGLKVSGQNSGMGGDPSKVYLEYYYDNSGNRTTRQLITLISSNSSEFDEEDEEKNKDFLNNNLGEREIHIYPNPVKVELTVEIQNGDEEESYYFFLYDIQGKLIMETNRLGNGSRTLNLSAYPDGIYILVLNAGYDKIEYKIVKK